MLIYIREHLYRHHIESLDDIKLEQLKSRKGLAGTEKERWIAVYRILFPGDDFSKMPTPCTDRPSKRKLKYADYFIRL
jgi:hypothetical protein